MWSERGRFAGNVEGEGVREPRRHANHNSGRYLEHSRKAIASSYQRGWRALW